MQRRDILQGKTHGMADAALSASGEATQEQTKSFLLVHGAWHCGGHWTRVSAGLAARGHRLLAIDLPGAGLNAAYPDSFINGDQAALATEPSPLARSYHGPLPRCRGGPSARTGDPWKGEAGVP